MYPQIYFKHNEGFKKVILGNSLMIQWLGLSAFPAVTQVQSLVRELRS